MSEKMKKKKNWRYHHFTYCTKNYDHMMHDGLTDVWMDRLTDRQKKWHIEVGAPPKNNPQLIEAKIKIRKLMEVNI